MDSKVVVGTGGSFGFVSGLADSQTAWLANMVNLYPKIHLCCVEHKHLAVLQPCGVNFFQCAIVSLLAALATEECRVFNCPWC